MQMHLKLLLSKQRPRKMGGGRGVGWGNRGGGTLIIDSCVAPPGKLSLLDEVTEPSEALASVQAEREVLMFI